MAEAAALALLSEVVDSVVGSVVDALTRQLSYVFSHNDIIKRLKLQVSNLKNARYRLQLSAYEIKKVSELLHDFNRIINKAPKLLESAAKVEQVGCCGSLRSRYNSSRKATLMIKDIERLLCIAEKHLNSQYTSASANSSGTLTTKELIDALHDDEIITVGVFGKNSARKTSELIKVCEIVNEEVFSELAIVVVSEGENYLSKIQDDLADMLGLTFKQTANFSERANLLCKTISSTDRILIILENVFQKFDLKSVGIPSKEVDHYNGRKVIISSQEERVCLEMGAQDIIPIEDFSDVAWSIFTERSGKWVHNAGAQSIAKSLVDKRGPEGYEVENLAKEVESWIKETKKSILERSRPQMQTTQNEHRIDIPRFRGPIGHAGSGPGVVSEMISNLTIATFGRIRAWF